MSTTRSILPSAIRLGDLRRNTLSWCRRTRISACSAPRDRTRPTTAQQINLHKSLIARIVSRFADDRHQGWVCGRDNADGAVLSREFTLSLSFAHVPQFSVEPAIRRIGFSIETTKRMDPKEDCHG